MADRPLVVIGAGGVAREVAWIAEHCAAGPFEVGCFVDRDDSETCGSLLNGVPVIGIDEAEARFRAALAVCAVGCPTLRQRLVGEAEARGFGFATLVHRDYRLAPSVEIGEGSIVYPGALMTVNVRIGRHVQVNPGCSVMHDAVIDDFATLTPGARIAGCVRVGRGAFVGTGAVVVNGTPERYLTIGAGATVGAGACVVADVAPGKTVAGVPAKPTRKD